MKAKLLLMVIVSFVTATASNAQDNKRSNKEKIEKGSKSDQTKTGSTGEKNVPEADAQAEEKGLASLTADWPPACQKAVVELETQYGRPDLANEEVVVWKNKGNWEMIFVSKDENQKTLPAKYMESMKIAANKKSAENADRQQM